MKALTICQPWAWAIVHGPKRVENRRWPTRYRGPLLIHAGKSHDWLGTDLHERLHPPAYEMAYGAIVGLATLSSVTALWPGASHPNPWAEGPWCWWLRDVHAFARPVPWRRGQGLWDADERDPLLAAALAACGYEEAA